MSYQHEIRVRYGECDQQGVVFNANYMAYMDDATEVWTRGLAPNGDYRELGWEWMVVRAAVEWQSSARNADLLHRSRSHPLRAQLVRFRFPRTGRRARCIYRPLGLCERDPGDATAHRHAGARSCAAGACTGLGHPGIDGSAQRHRDCQEKPTDEHQENAPRGLPL